MEKKKTAGSTELCTAKHPETGESVCDRPVWNIAEKRCIFHSRDKPAEEFKKHFLKELQQVDGTVAITAFDCRCFVFPPDTQFEHLLFKKPVLFNFAHFGDNVSFEDSEFGKKASFDRATFGKGARFVKARFGGRTSFFQTTFGDNANFWEATFGDGLKFRKVTFGDGAHFLGAEFGNESDFTRAEFGKEASFIGAKFGDRLKLWKAKFDKEASFNNATFGDGASFYRTTFCDGANFDEAEFGARSSFYRTIFGDDANFMGSTFGKRAYFSGATFGVEASFYYATFGDGARFKEIKFGDSLNFSSARFTGETVFEDFPIVDFTGVTFDTPGSVRMHRVDLRSFLLRNTNVQEVDFLGCTWREVGKRKHAVFDEIHYSGTGGQEGKSAILETVTLPEIEQLYRRLQLNFENSKRYGEAGDFYIGVMEMRRRQLAAGSSLIWWRRARQNVLSMIALYRLVSEYGERYTRCLWWMLAVFLLFPALYLLTGFDYPAANPADAVYERIDYDPSYCVDIPRFAGDYVKAAVVSLHAFTFQRDVPYRLTVASRALSILESAVSAALLALFLLAVRRRFRR